MGIHRLDVRGLACPLPVLKARRRMRDLATGDVLEVLATDPAAAREFPEFCRIAGHELAGVEPAEEATLYRLVKAGT